MSRLKAESDLRNEFGLNNRLNCFPHLFGSPSTARGDSPDRTQPLRKARDLLPRGTSTSEQTINHGLHRTRLCCLLHPVARG
jgi:hypothetical protein